MRRLATMVGVLTTLVAGCNDTPASNGPWWVTRDTVALFQTDSLSYTLVHKSPVYIIAISATLANRTTRPMYFTNCNGATAISLQKQTASGWQSVISPILAACLSAPIVVGAGATHTFTVTLSAGEPGSNFGPKVSTTDLDGEYRLIWGDAFSSYDGTRATGAPLPESSRVSNRFAVRVAER